MFLWLHKVILTLCVHKVKRGKNIWYKSIYVKSVWLNNSVTNKSDLWYVTPCQLILFFNKKCKIKPMDAFCLKFDFLLATIITFRGFFIKLKTFFKVPMTEYFTNYISHCESLALNKLNNWTIYYTTHTLIF